MTLVSVSGGNAPRTAASRCSSTPDANGLTINHRRARSPRRVAADAVDEDRGEAIGEVVGVATGLEPGVGPVRCRQDEQGRGADVQIRPQVARLDAVAEQRAPALLVAAPLADDLLAVLALEVAPLAGEDGRDVELFRHDAQVPAQREPNALAGRRVVGDRVERVVERRSAGAHGRVEQLLLRADERVQRALLHAELLRERVHRRAVEATLGEEPRRCA